VIKINAGILGSLFTYLETNFLVLYIAQFLKIIINHTLQAPKETSLGTEKKM